MQGRETRNAQPQVDCRWFAVRTRHHHERTVTELLLSKGFQIFFPTYEATRRWADRWKRLTLPLFPGYLFFANEIGRRMQVLCTPGVQSIVQTANVPAPIPDEEIVQIRRLLDSKLAVEPHPYLKEGDRVRINAGPLTGAEGILARKKDGLRLVVSIQMLGQSAAVSIDARVVEPVSASRSLLHGSLSLQRDKTASRTGSNVCDADPSEKISPSEICRGSRALLTKATHARAVSGSSSQPASGEIL